MYPHFLPNSVSKSLGERKVCTWTSQSSLFKDWVRGPGFDCTVICKGTYIKMKKHCMYICTYIGTHQILMCIDMKYHVCTYVAIQLFNNNYTQM